MHRMSLMILPLLAACAEERAPEPVPSPTPAPPAPAPAPSPTPLAALTPDGWGPLRIGMTRDQVEAVLGSDAEPDAAGGPDPAACDQFRPARAPAGLLVMVEDGRLTRVSLIRDAAIRTDRGLGLGATVEAVQQAYRGAIRSEPHEYLAPPGRYLTYRHDGGGADARGIRYEIGTDGRVTAIHAGGRAITYSEDCA